MGFIFRRLSALALAASIAGLAFPSRSVAEPPAASVAGAAVSGDSDVAAPAEGARMLLGTYVGPFGAHRITVCLQNLVGQTVNGYSVTAGNERAFSGSLTDNPRAFEVHAREPGDHPEDGSFVFLYRPDAARLSGVWTPNDPHLKTVSFDLPRRAFRYDPKPGRYPQASARALKTADVENLRPEDLRIMRNEIYARHGYTFRLVEMRSYFESQDWYMPISFNVSNQLTPIEQKNAALIKSYENYGREHYDDFGR